MRRILNLLIIISYVLTIISAQYNQILKYKCETDLDCKHRLVNSICIENECKSEKNIDRQRRQTLHGEKMLGEDCSWSYQCRQTPVDGTKVCRSRKCQCSHGYIPVDAYRCIKDFEPLSPTIYTTSTYRSDPPGYGSACLTDRDCQQTGVHLECIRGTCVCLDGYVPLGKYICYNTRGEGAQILESSSIVPFLRTNTPAINRSVDDNQIFRSIGKIGNTCTNDYFCRRAVFQSHCYNGKCACMDGYIAVDLYTCIKRETTSTTTTPIPFDYKSLLGGRCLTKRNCHTSIAVCLKSICTCPRGYFPIDDWTCFEEPETSDEESIYTTPTIPTTTTLLSTTTSIFRWWPWSPTPTTPRLNVTLKNALRARCLLNRQCTAMDRNSHCTTSGRCVCNSGYELRTTRKGQRCVVQILNEDNCD